MTRFVPYAALLLLACAPAEPTRAPIVGGTLQMEERAVVAVQALGGVGLCTGTLISPRVVLTAKHCVQAVNAPTPFPATAITVGVGFRADDFEAEYRARAIFTTPGAYSQDPRIGIAGALLGEDIGLIVLRQPVEGVTPIPIRRDEPNDLVGQTFTAVGFGQRPGASAGVKYTTTGTLSRIDGTVLFTAMTICQGDSGGPMIQETPERRVVGVASFGQAGACPSARDGYNALFAHLDLIDAAVAVAGDCVEVREEACNSLDDDCDGTLDEGCANTGEACEEDGDCAFASPSRFLPDVPASRCEDLGAGPVCTRICDQTTPHACDRMPHLGSDTFTEVPDGSCSVLSGCEGRCAIVPAGSATIGTSCSADTDCASRHCGDPGDGRRRCLPVCRADAGQCPEGDACAASPPDCGYCVEANLVVGSRGLGEPCEEGADCALRLCVEGACASACAGDAQCPGGFRCEDGACQPGTRPVVGEPCSGDADCGAGGRCASGGACTRPCASDEECPEGRCGAVDGEPSCVLDAPALGASCSGACALGDECVDGRCERSCGVEASCPLGYRCARDGELGPRCVSRGGCSASPARGGSETAWILVGLALVCLRRPRWMH